LFNLSFDSLTSREALQRLRDVQKNEPDLWTKISTRQYKLAKQDDIMDTDQEPAFTDDADTSDGSDVPVEAILQHIVDGGENPPAGYSVDPNGLLTPHNESEVYESEVAGNAHVAEASNTGEGEESKEMPRFGRGQRKRIANTLYNDFWSHN
jgi:hypothetical protein